MSDVNPWLDVVGDVEEGEEVIGDISEALHTMKAVAFRVFCKKISQDGTLGNDQQLHELVIWTVNYYKNMTEISKQYYKEMSGESVKSSAENFCKNSSVPNCSELWAEFRMMVETRGIFEFSFDPQYEVIVNNAGT